MRVALVHELLIKLGGAERVLQVMSEMFPDAPIFTLLYDKQKCGEIFAEKQIITSNLQTLYNLKAPFSYLRTKMPQAVERFDFKNFDLVISSSSAFAHGILTDSETRHICYCHSPARYLWDWYFNVIKEQEGKSFGNMKKLLIPYFSHKLRLWDRAAADRPDKIIANSKTVQKRIKKFWGQESEILFPPVDVHKFKASKTHENYFLIVSALSPFKRIDLAIRAFSLAPKHKLVIIGDGSEREMLQRMAGKNIEFLGRKNDDVVREYMRNCRAFIFPGLEDFGIAPIEAMACGKPVIAFGHGGITESLIPGKTGVFFKQDTPESLLDGMAEFFELEQSFDSEVIRARAEEFSKEKFIAGLEKYIK